MSTVQLIFLSFSCLRNWFKGQDTVYLLRFLQDRLESELPLLEGEVKCYFEDIVSAVSAATSFLKCLYGTALFLTCEERDVLLESGHACSRAFQKCAQRAYTWGVTRWKIMPKKHMFGEVLHSMEVGKRKSLPSISPLAFCTQLDEDFIGKVSSMSRMVSIRTVHERTLKRYQIALAAKW